MTRRKRKSRDNSLIQAVAASVPALAAFPAAFFVARSTYWHLLHGWHLTLWPGVNVAVAVVAGLVVEGLGVVAIFLALAFRRWNRVQAVKNGYDRAPFWLAVAATGLYVLATVALLVVLEAWPDAARFAPVMFPLLTVVGGLCWAMHDQHRDRLAERGLSWNWVAQYEDQAVTKPIDLPTSVEDSIQESEVVEDEPVIVWSQADFNRAAAIGDLDPAEMTGDKIAELAGVSGSTGRRWKRTWADNGRQ